MKGLYHPLLLILLTILTFSSCSKDKLNVPDQSTASLALKGIEPTVEVDNVTILVFDKENRYLSTEKCGRSLNAQLTLTAGVYSLLVLVNENEGYRITPEAFEIGKTRSRDVVIHISDPISGDPEPMWIGLLDGYNFDAVATLPVSVNLKKIDCDNCDIGVEINPWEGRNTEVEL